jgi:cupin fold WbuC family metalloprotein
MSLEQPEYTPGGLRLLAQNAEVLYAESPLVTLSRPDIEWLKQRALKNPRKRIRICTHPDSGDRLHEMLIVHMRDTYVRPHKHLNKSESFHVISGEVDVVLFRDAGAVDAVIPMGEYGSGKRFYYRLNHERYHTLLIRSDVLVFHEVTNGPFRREDMAFAPWAPEEEESEKRAALLTRIAHETASLVP